MKITKELTIREVLQVNPKTAEVLMRNGMACVGCPGAARETLEQAAAGHGMDLEKLLKELNEVVE